MIHGFYIELLAILKTQGEASETDIYCWKYIPLETRLDFHFILWYVLIHFDAFQHLMRNQCSAKEFVYEIQITGPHGIIQHLGIYNTVSMPMMVSEKMRKIIFSLCLINWLTLAKSLDIIQNYMCIQTLIMQYKLLNLLWNMLNLLWGMLKAGVGVGHVMCISTWSIAGQGCGKLETSPAVASLEQSWRSPELKWGPRPWAVYGGEPRGLGRDGEDDCSISVLTLPKTQDYFVKMNNVQLSSWILWKCMLFRFSNIVK